MRRWMIVLAIAGLFVALAAAPGAAKQDVPPDMDLLEAGETTFGAVTLSGDDKPAFPPDEDGNHWVVKRSGCGLKGTFPVYHGTFDWKTGHLYAERRFHGIGDGGTAWDTYFGIDKEDGPLHATDSSIPTPRNRGKTRAPKNPRAIHTA